MNHMDTPNEEGYNWPHEYGHYEGPGQKIRGDDDELFASMLARKMKIEFENDRNPLASQRLVLAIVSVCAVVVLFGILVLALAAKVASSGGASVALGWGFVATCAVIFAVNGFFNATGNTSNEKATDSQEKQKEQIKTK